MKSDRGIEEIQKRYFKDISKYPLLDHSEEIDLSRKARRGDEIARRKLVLSNLKLVITIAKSYASYNVPLLDLIEEGKRHPLHHLIRHFSEKKVSHMLANLNQTPPNSINIEEHSFTQLHQLSIAQPFNIT